MKNHSLSDSLDLGVMTLPTLVQNQSHSDSGSLGVMSLPTLMQNHDNDSVGLGVMSMSI